MFDTTLVASNPRREARRKLATLPAALAVHALAIALVMAGQLLAVDRVIEPTALEAYVDVQLPEPPPAPPAAPEGEKVTSATTAPVATEEPVQITEIPSQPAQAVASGTPGTPGGVPGGVPGGTPGGIPGGISETTAPPPPPPEPVTYTLELVSTPPIALSQPAPPYPEPARRMRVQGTVLIRAVIDEAGDVIDVRALNRLPLGCTEAALDAVRSWRYRPATLNDHAVRVQLEVKVTFRLAESS